MLRGQQRRKKVKNRRSVKSIHGSIGFCDLLARPVDTVTSVPEESRFPRVTAGHPT